MPKPCDVQVLVRIDGQVIGSDYAMGTIEDDGATVVVPIGYLPNIAAAVADDIVLHITEPLETYAPVEFVGRIDNAEAGLSFVTLRK